MTCRFNYSRNSPSPLRKVLPWMRIFLSCCIFLLSFLSNFLGSPPPSIVHLSWERSEIHIQTHPFIHSLSDSFHRPSLRATLNRLCAERWGRKGGDARVRPPVLEPKETPSTTKISLQTSRRSHLFGRGRRRGGAARCIVQTESCVLQRGAERDDERREREEISSRSPALGLGTLTRAP